MRWTDMPFIEERDGLCWAIEFGPGCNDCWGLGATFVHEITCESDFCVGSGDEHSCNGDWLPCDSCGTVEPVR